MNPKNRYFWTHLVCIIRRLASNKGGITPPV